MAREISIIAGLFLCLLSLTVCDTLSLYNKKGVIMKIQVEQKSVAKLVPVRRDLCYLLTPEEQAWLTEVRIEDYDESGVWKDKELEEC